MAVDVPSGTQASQPEAATVSAETPLLFACDETKGAGIARIVDRWRDRGGYRDRR